MNVAKDGAVRKSDYNTAKITFVNSHDLVQGRNTQRPTTGGLSLEFKYARPL